MADEEISDKHLVDNVLSTQTVKKSVIKYESVDLGLPSGLKWADRNVGAASPEAYGNYFMWGSTKRGINKPCDWAHAPFNNGSSSFDSAYFNSVKDCVCPGGVLASEYDAAHVNMGGSWRMPTLAEMVELIDGTTQSVEKQNGVKGVRFISKANGNSIFIPFAGRRYGSVIDYNGICGFVWSSSLCACNAYLSHYIISYDGNTDVSRNLHNDGLAVRGVHE